jgi:hypothetical protein
MIAGHGRLTAALEMAEVGIPIPRNPDPTLGPTVTGTKISRCSTQLFNAKLIK